MADRCGGCPHAVHPGKCRGKASSRQGRHCQRLLDDDGRAVGFACGAENPPCPCPWRTCKCGARVAVAMLDKDQAAAYCADHGLDPGQAIEVPVIRGSAGDPSGYLEVWQRPDGYLMCRELAGDEHPAEGHWRGMEHTGACQPL